MKNFLTILFMVLFAFMLAITASIAFSISSAMCMGEDQTAELISANYSTLFMCFILIIIELIILATFCGIKIIKHKHTKIS